MLQICGLSGLTFIFSYNSAVFPSLAGNSYNWLVVSPDFLHGATWSLSAANTTLYSQGNETVMGLIEDKGKPVLQTLSNSIAGSKIGWPHSDAVSQMQIAAQNGNTFQRLDRVQCLKTYSSAFSNHSDLLMISSDSSTNNNSIFVGGSVGVLEPALASWMCRNSNTFSCLKLSTGRYSRKDEQALVADWNVVDYPIDYCLASFRSLNDSCSLVYSYRIMISKGLCCIGQQGRLLTSFSCLCRQCLQMFVYLLHCSSLQA